MCRYGWRGSSDRRSRNHSLRPGIDRNAAREGGRSSEKEKEREREGEGERERERNSTIIITQAAIDIFINDIIFNTHELHCIYSFLLSFSLLCAATPCVPPSLTHLSHMHTHIHTHTATTNSLCGDSSNSKKKKNHLHLQSKKKRMTQPERMLLISRICEQHMLRHAKERQKRTTFLVSFLRQPTRNEAFTCMI